jgi:tetratricopeptide (TPR) repeat protein/transcriptional regulator with XRE-family HTH domain
VTEELPVTFGQFLRELRERAGLTRARLAHMAKVSERTIASLELGGKVKSPRGATVSGLAQALGLQGLIKIQFEALARGQPLPGGLPVMAATAPPRTLPRDIASFAGREPEVKKLLEMAAGTGGAVSIHAIEGMPGIGKTTLAVHAARMLAEQFGDGQIFLELNGHKRGQAPVNPADALVSLLEAVGADLRQIPHSLDGRARLWRHTLAGKRMLLLLDDAFDSEQVRPLLPGTAGTLVVVTSRQNLTALEDAHPVRLDVLEPDEAAGLLVRLADRAGLRPDDQAVVKLAELCGRLPLALGLIGRQLHHNRAWAPADLAADLARARDRLGRMQSDTASVTAAFDLSYQALSEDQKRMFRRLGLHPGNDIDSWAAAALDDASPDGARGHLQALSNQNMIIGLSYDRYRLHDLIREYAAERAVAEDASADRDAAVRRLLDYYLFAAATADRHLAQRTPVRSAGTYGSRPTHSPEMPTRESAVEWMNAELHNLQDAVAYMAEHGHLSQAVAIPAALAGFLRSQGHWDQGLKLHAAALDAAERAGDRLGEAGALTDLGDLQYLIGSHDEAGASLTRALNLSRSLGNHLAEANALNQIGVLQQQNGELPAATASLTQAVELSRSLGDRLGEAGALTNLGAVEFMKGDFAEAAESQERALEISRSVNDRLGEAKAMNILGGVRQATGDYPAAIDSTTEALELYRSLGDRIGEAYATGNLGIVHYLTGDHAAAASWLESALRQYRELGSHNGQADTLSNLGVLYREAEDYPAATDYLVQAINLHHGLGDHLGESTALSELGVVQHATGDYPAATANLTRAVELAHGIGERAEEAEALNNLGDLYLDSATADQARETYEQALTIAEEISTPLAQARALEGIGQCFLQSGQRSDGIAMLQRSLAIYGQIKSPRAKRVTSLLRDQGS